MGSDPAVATAFCHDGGVTSAGWLVIATLVIAVGWLGAVALHYRRRLSAAGAETEHLRSLVKQRVERPNVFSHEVRTPLTLIRGAAELLAEETSGPLTDRQREFVSTISANAQQVITLAQNMLTEARIDAQLFELSLQDFDLRKLVRDTVRDARRVHAAAIRLENGGVPLPVLADRALLSQAMWNLVNNSCRHAGDAASITVSASRGRRRHAGSRRAPRRPPRGADRACDRPTPAADRRRAAG